MVLALELISRLKNGARIYLHCWGGHGRTGTLVSIILSILYDLTAQEAMTRCQVVVVVVVVVVRVVVREVVVVLRVVLREGGGDGGDVDSGICIGKFL